MQCKKCSQEGVLVEAVQGGGQKRTCQKCGYSEVVDREGRKLLTDDAPPRNNARELLG